MAEKEYIERGRLLESIESAHENGGMGDIVAGTLKRYVKRVPADDVVEVVRCKDCKKHGRIDCIVNRKMACGDHETTTKANDFCSYGERKEQTT